MSAYSREYRARTPHKTSDRQLTNRKYHRRAKYGLTDDAFQALLLGQGGVCAICGEAESATTSLGEIRELSVDHCHTTGKVRGLLCRACNVGLGSFRDTPAYLLSAVDYLMGG